MYYAIKIHTEVVKLNTFGQLDLSHSKNFQCVKYLIEGVKTTVNHINYERQWAQIKI